MRAMKPIARALPALLVLAVAAGCERPNLRATGGGYAPDSSAAPLTGPAHEELAAPASLPVDVPPAPEPRDTVDLPPGVGDTSGGAPVPSGAQSSDASPGTATPR